MFITFGWNSKFEFEQYYQSIIQFDFENHVNEKCCSLKELPKTIPYFTGYKIYPVKFKDKS